MQACIAFAAACFSQFLQSLSFFLNKLLYAAMQFSPPRFNANDAQRSHNVALIGHINSWVVFP